MDTRGLLDQLNYINSPCFIQSHQFNRYPTYAHIFRRAPGLEGVYTLKESCGNNTHSESIIPFVYVCKAHSEEEARNIHRLVWNQNTVPFLIVDSPKHIRLYRGFHYDTKKRDQDQHIIDVARDAKNILDRLSDFTAESIDNRRVWDHWSHVVTTDTKVDQKLLGNLKKLGEWLCKNNEPKLTRHDANALIGKYVYLRYLRDRKILSDEKLNEWNIQDDQIFGRKAKPDSLNLVDKKLKEWLNGTIFPFPSSLNEIHVRAVASTFIGDEPESWQMHLNFEAYDFEKIPIETLSVVYQQFLHTDVGGEIGVSQGRKLGAYYTPIHLVNFILDELDAKKPLEKGMTVFDPACGSGAFLVQSYRRLIERELAKYPKGKLKLTELRDVLTKHIYGMEVDEDACGITELSLMLTLLDYVEPPDLKNKPQFKLPELRNKNIFLCKRGFFDPNPEWENSKPQNGFDWIVGNPPWKELTKHKIDNEADWAAYDWITNKETKQKFPVGGIQLAEAFSWKVTQSINPKGIIGLLMPAMTLFKSQSTKYRQKFFISLNVWCIVNFANLRRHLFVGSIEPAAAFFYSLTNLDENSENNSILTYAPFAITQFFNKENASTKKEKKRVHTWTCVVDASAIKEIPLSEVVQGNYLTWKIAMWGTQRDKQLIHSFTRQYQSLLSYEKEHGLSIHQGLELRNRHVEEDTEPLPWIINKKGLVIDVLKGIRNLFSIPDEAFKVIDKSEAYVRKGRLETPLSVCYPPHIIVDAARRFAIYSDEFFVIPARQIGISGDKTKTELLKFLSVYLSSDFVRYHQFLSSSMYGIERNRTSLDELKNTPIPFDDIFNNQLSEWLELHNELVDASKQANRSNKQPELFDTGNYDSNHKNLQELVNQLNDKVYKLLGIREHERYLIEDFCNVRIKLNDGSIANEAMAPPPENEMKAYAEILADELDVFLSGKKQHKITVFHSDEMAIIELDHLKTETSCSPKLIKVNDQTRNEFEKLRHRLLKNYRQWMYFDRGLKIFEGRKTYLCKPMHRLYWLRSQALADADEIIADKLIAAGD